MSTVPLGPKVNDQECDTRISLWDYIHKEPVEGSGGEEPSLDAQEAVGAQAIQVAEAAEEKVEPTLIIEPVLEDAREAPEAKVLKQLSEMTKLLEQQTTLMYAQQKLLEDLAGRQKKLEKRKPGMAKKLKSLIHKGKIIWSAL